MREYDIECAEGVYRGEKRWGQKGHVYHTKQLARSGRNRGWRSVVFNVAAEIHKEASAEGIQKIWEPQGAWAERLGYSFFPRCGCKRINAFSCWTRGWHLDHGTMRRQKASAVVTLITVIGRIVIRDRMRVTIRQKESV